MASDFRKFAAALPTLKRLGVLLLCLAFLWVSNNLWTGIILEGVFAWTTEEHIFIVNPASTPTKQHYSYVNNAIPEDVYFYAVDCDIVDTHYLLEKGIRAVEYLQAKNVVSCKYHYKLGPYAITGMQKKYNKSTPYDFKFKHLGKEIRPEAHDSRMWFFERTYFPFTNLDSYTPFNLLTILIAAGLAMLAGFSFKNEFINIQTALSKKLLSTTVLITIDVLRRIVQTISYTAYNPKHHIFSQLFSNEHLWRTVFWAPLQEELFYRAFMITFLLRYSSPAFAVIISSILFALGHHHGIFGTSFLFFGGIIYGILWVRTKSIFLVFFAHALYNFSGFLLKVFWGA